MRSISRRRRRTGFIVGAGVARRGGFLVPAEPLESLRILNQRRRDELAAGGDARQFRAQLFGKSGVRIEKRLLSADTLPPKRERLAQIFRDGFKPHLSHP
jgi:hypothetical protein